MCATQAVTDTQLLANALYSALSTPLLHSHRHSCTRSHQPAATALGQKIMAPSVKQEGDTHHAIALVEAGTLLSKRPKRQLPYLRTTCAYVKAHTAGSRRAEQSCSIDCSCWGQESAAIKCCLCRNHKLPGEAAVGYKYDAQPRALRHSSRVSSLSLQSW